MYDYGFGYIFIPWVMLSLLVGWFWQWKGRAFGWGVFWSLLLSPLVGFVIGVLSESDQAAREQRDIDSGDKKRCEWCAEIIRRDARVCRYCGRELAERNDLASVELPASPEGAATRRALKKLLGELLPGELQVLQELVSGVANQLNGAAAVQFSVSDSRRVRVMVVGADGVGRS